MITARVQINQSPEVFSLENETFEITLPSLPRIGDQILMKKVISAIEKEIDTWRKKCPNVRYGFSTGDLSFVTNIAYGDNDTVYIGLAHNPHKFMCGFRDYNDKKNIFHWSILDKIPGIGELVYYESDGFEAPYRYIHDVVLSINASASICIYTEENKPATPVEVRNTVSAHINNTVDVEVVNPVSVENTVQVESRGTLDVNVKKFDYGCIYVRNDNDRY